MSRTLLSIGECMIEMAPNGAGDYAMGFAGDTFNTAWYVARVSPEVEVGYLSAVGDDAPSQQMAAFMRKAGVTPHLAVRQGRTVGLYLINLKDGERSFAYWRSTSAATTLGDDLDDLPDMGPGDVAFFSGITLAILPAAGRAKLLAALRAARARGVIVAFDPNLRPRLWPDTAAMCAAIMEGAAVADIALPSFEDEAAFFGDADVAATGARYADAGAGIVVVKDGPRPVLVREGDRLMDVAPAKVAEVIDTTAAGDSFNAGFLCGYLAGAPLADAAAKGCALSAKVIAARGALVAV